MADTQDSFSDNWQYNESSTYVPNYDTYTSWDESDLAKRLSLGHAGVCAFGVVLNLFGIVVLVRLLMQRVKVSPVYYLFLAVTIADLLALALWLIFLLIAYARPGTPLIVATLTESHSYFTQLMVHIWHFPMEVFTSASDWMIAGAALLCSIHIALKSSNRISVLQVGLVILVGFVFSLALNIPNWTTVKISKVDGELRAYHDFTEKKLRYFQHSVIGTWYIPRGLSLLMGILLPVLSAIFKVEKELKKVAIMLIAIIVWVTVLFIPYLVHRIVYRRPDLRFNHIIILYSAVRYAVILQYTAKVFFYCCFNSTFRRTAINTLLCRRNAEKEEISQKRQPEKTDEESTNFL